MFVYLEFIFVFDFLKSILKDQNLLVIHYHNNIII